MLRSIALPIANTVSNYGDTRALTRENDALRLENERLNAELASLRESQVQTEELQRLLEVKNAIADSSSWPPASPRASPNNLRQIGRHRPRQADGIKVGMPVVTEGNTLVGTISKVNDDLSWVKLVTDVDSAVSSITWSRVPRASSPAATTAS